MNDEKHQQASIDPGSALTKRQVLRLAKTAFAVVVALVGVTAGIYGIKDHQSQSISDQKKIARLSYTAVPTFNGSDHDVGLITLGFSNLGPATTGTILVDYFCPQIASGGRCSVNMVSKPATSSAEIITRTTPGHYQIVIKPLSPADGLMFGVTYQTEELWSNLVFS